MKSRTTLLGCGVLIAMITGNARGGSPVTTDRLLDEMTDLERLTQLPDPAYTTRQFSSYDRESKSPEEGWFANDDRGEFLRTEINDGRKEYVLMDAEGPGCVVRIWSANPSGDLRIYLDGHDRPIIKAKMSELLSGNDAAFPSPIAGRRAAGWNLYFPIPYAKHCKITSDDGGFYYHVNYRTYEPGTPVITMAPGELARLSGKIRGIARDLQQPRRSYQRRAVGESVPFALTIAPASHATLANVTGSRVILGLTLRIEAADIPASARGVILDGIFDAKQTVSCPVGDFFGTAPGLNPLETLPVGITDEEHPVLWSHWPMPFAHAATLELRNLTHQTVQLRGELIHGPYEWTDRSLHFHAKWRQERDIPTRPFIDWTHLDCTGQGRFVGGTLYFINTVKKWWGEGDEKIYVDGETFPSHFGTGTEDYYGYAWGSPELFSHAYHAQSRCDGPGTYGNTALCRFHILDDIPFNRSFKLDIENWHWMETIKVHRAAVSYWYSRPGGTDFFAPITAEDAVVVEVPPMGTPGVHEGEDLLILHSDGGSMPQRDDPRYSNETYLRWHAHKPGDRITFAFQVKEGGRRHIRIRLARAHDFGTFQFLINDRKVGGPLDCSEGPDGPTEEISLGEFDLARGQNTLTAEFIKGRAQRNDWAFGLDFIRVE